MALESFYGGRPGITPVIKTTFKYIDRKDPAYNAAVNAGKTPPNEEIMDVKFSEGDSYKKVWYNELCIIDATNKNNPNNGHLYRRTLKGAGDTGESLCAEYLGRIVGASGANPALIVSNLDTIENLSLSLGEGARVVYPTDSEGNIGQGTQLPNNYPLISAGTVNGMLVPGKDAQNNFNDDIKYTWVNVMSDTDEEFAAKIYMGFQIPYLVNEFEAQQLSWTTIPTINKVDGFDHPFYDKWRLGLPQGVRGNAASGLRTAYPKDFINTYYGNTPPEEIAGKYIYDFSKIFNINAEGISSFSVPNTQQDIENATPEELKNPTEDNQEQPILVYDYTIYNKTVGQEDSSAQKLTFFLGLYRQIEDVRLTDDGKITVIYNSAAEKTSEILNENYLLSWITSITITENGLWTITSNNGNKSINQEVQLPYPDSMSINAGTGNIKVNFKNETSLMLKEEDSNGQPTSENFALNYVKSISIDENSKVLSSNHYINNALTVLNGGKGFNYVSAAVIDDYNHLLIFFASDQYRPLYDNILINGQIDSQYSPKALTNGGYRIHWNNQTFRNGFAYTTGLDNNTNTIPIIINEYDFWLDLGLVHTAERGIKMSAEVNYTNCPIPNQVIKSYTIDEFIQNILNCEYWEYSGQQVENPYYNGTIGHYENNEIQYLENGYGEKYWGTFLAAPDVADGTAYFYDYDNSTWVCIGEWGQASYMDIAIDTPQQGDPELANYGTKLLSLGIDNSKSTQLPDFWSTSNV